MKTVGLFFGTFNPIHNGHLAVAKYFAEKTEIEEIWLVVSPQSPFKKKGETSENHHRLEMVRLAVEGFPKLKACDVEFNLPTPGYTVDTLNQLKNKFPEHNFILILGEDNIAKFNQWKAYKDILKNHSVYVYPRESSDEIPDELIKNQKVRFFDAPRMEISSTEIRKMIKKGEKKIEFLPSKIQAYIKNLKFYL